MPSHWIHPSSAGGTVSEEMESRRDSFDLSEDFYGFLGGGYTALFDNFPEIFKQVLAIAKVDFSEILPILVLHYNSEGNEINEKEKALRKDIYLVRRKFRELNRSLHQIPDLAGRIKFPADGYAPEKEYFEDYEEDQFEKTKEECDYMDEDYYGSDNRKLTFGREIRTILNYLDQAIKDGDIHFWFSGR